MVDEGVLALFIMAGVMEGVPEGRGCCIDPPPACCCCCCLGAAATIAPPAETEPPSETLGWSTCG